MQLSRKHRDYGDSPSRNEPADKAGIAATLGLEPEQVRVIAPDVGGGFGGKGFDVEDILMGALARATGRPCRWTETRSEHMVALHHGRAQWAERLARDHARSLSG